MTYSIAAPARPVGRTTCCHHRTASLAIAVAVAASTLASAQTPAPAPAAATKPAPAKKPAKAARHRLRPLRRPQGSRRRKARPSGDEQPQLIYSPWTKFCLKGQEANAKQVCFTGKDGRIESGMPVVAAVLIEPEGEPKKILRITLPLGMQLVHGTRVDRRPGPADDRALRDLLHQRLHGRLRGQSPT